MAFKGFEVGKKYRIIKGHFITEFLCYTEVVYVYEKLGDEMPIYGIFREITENGTTYWKETY